jgi:predicted SAM-dependent methyltransferase
MRKILYKFKKHFLHLIAYKKSLSNLAIKKVIVGSNTDEYEGWVATNYPHLDITSKFDWFVLGINGKIDNILAEHVWEHLTETDGLLAIKNCFKALKKGGRLRIAVPDGFHPNKEYINHVKVGGIGIGADDHKILYNYIILSSFLKKSGFSNIILVEYWNEHGEFKQENYSDDFGFIKRSFNHDKRNINSQPNYTSLIIDAIK